MKRGAASTGVKAHLFEHTQEPASAKPGSRAPLQLVMLSKAGPESGGKLNSHYWFFQALCTYVQPKFVYVRAAGPCCQRPLPSLLAADTPVCRHRHRQLLDAGIVPAPDALPRLQTEMTINRQLGACCGEITPWPENVLSLVSPVVAGQVFEFKTSYMMSKGLESMFGHVAHLPGGFTGYRYRAIAPDPRRPLEGSPLEEVSGG